MVFLSLQTLSCVLFPFCIFLARLPENAALKQMTQTPVYALLVLHDRNCFSATAILSAGNASGALCEIGV